jgi:hypothetical protein
MLAMADEREMPFVEKMRDALTFLRRGIHSLTFLRRGIH